ncbi:kelch repeat-containing protein [Archangium violaceum]|uniref:kelch repeat-containing protein n=1 Tax=Archangium violaceum TaxID=83451 RepID=UPI0037BE3A44
MRSARASHSATLLPNGKVLVVGGFDGSAQLATNEEYDPATGTWSSTKNTMSTARHYATATLLPNGKVLVVGGNDGTTRLATAEVYDPATGTWSPTQNTMSTARGSHTATLLDNGKVLVVGGFDGKTALATAEEYDPATGAWSSTTAMTQGRYNHTATLLPGGKVLVVGGNTGSSGALTSAQEYDPVTHTWSSTTPMTQARYNHTATVMPGGKVLVVGGKSGSAILATAEVYDPATGIWSFTGSLPLDVQAREGHSTTLLPGGKILMVGGRTKVNGVKDELHPESAEYDPATGTWSSMDSMRLNQARAFHTATLLPGGQVLVVGGYDGMGRLPTAEVYEPGTASWSSTGSLNQARAFHTATLLPGGQALVAGGYDGRTGFATAELYRPATGTWSYTKNAMNQRRYDHTATLLPGGKVLVVGGNDGTARLSSAELYDPVFETWSATGSLNQVRVAHTATLLPNGKVLVAGGYEGHDGRTGIASAELYEPSTGTWSSTGPLNRARAFHTATLLPGGKVLVVGGSTGDTPLTSAEVYDSVSGTWSSTGPLSHARYNHTATFLPGGKVLVVGGNDGSEPLSSCEVYDPASGTWSSADSLMQARSNHTATLLPGGKLLVVAGIGSDSLVSAEVYDPATGAWSWAGSLTYARSGHTTTLLPGGKLLVVGGNNALTSAELYMDSVWSDAWRPDIADVSPSVLEPNTSLTVTGAKFRGFSNDGAGNPRSSPTNYPLLSLSSVENERWVPLLGRKFSDTSVSATLPYVPNGHYLLNVTTQGLTSSRMVSIINTRILETNLDDSTPALETQSTTATFWFSSASGDTFECSLDIEPFTACSSPKEYGSLGEGEHTFRVRVRDPVGNVDPTPAEHRWTVDTTAPDTLIDTASAPPAFTRFTSASFSFSSEEGASFECSLDGTAFTACSNPQSYSSLADGEHTFYVKATDRVGNVESNAAEHRWTVDTEPPARPNLEVPTHNQQLFTSRPVFSGTAEPGSTVWVFVEGVRVGETLANEGGYWELTSSPLDWGTHSATATAVDEAENTSEPSLEVTFATVQRGYFGMSCSAGPSAWLPWPWALVLLELLRRKRSH